LSNVQRARPASPKASRRGGSRFRLGLLCRLVIGGSEREGRVEFDYVEDPEEGVAEACGGGHWCVKWAARLTGSRCAVAEPYPAWEPPEQ
jgi:hypothetical protein